jgi:outer membrane protein
MNNMNKYVISIVFFFACSATMMAQQAKIGYFSYDAVLKSSPDYQTAMSNIETLRKQYDIELVAAQKEFTEKYELFLDQQAELVPAIREKRQADLQALMERNEKFSSEAQRLIKQAEKDILAPIKAKILSAIDTVGSSGHYLMIVNIDSEACPYIDASSSEDVTESIKNKLIP